ncbi:hypothetical protein [Aquisalinus flavus]|uniref:Uncharacterized protein n=1 Tax=Aquisalinus flavus TaxID=1526572 RepID=A0A8J2Y879_9PROT|nr:hypothetical protein [Aquisalinus flavus]MBD0425546.1 hypothetical protein [Aquisalinus flavus]UNE48827.1 hypothetical protein FF099_12595 [Aquisalinus flavus]GGD15213.1 hypothetical protein GCM10011342_24970 [Aquisalinus flavus]
MTEQMHIANSIALGKLPSDELEKHRGEVAILVDGEIRQFCSTLLDALNTAKHNFQAGTFSIMRVEPLPVDLGMLDCADYPG